MVKMDKMDTNKKREIKEKFLEELQDKDVGGNVTIALRRLGYARSTMYLWRSQDEKFCEAWDDAVLQGKETLADEAVHALRGQVLKGNITAIIFALKNLRSEQWMDRQAVTHEVPKLPELPIVIKDAIYERFKENISGKSKPRIKGNSKRKTVNVGSRKL